MQAQEKVLDRIEQSFGLFKDNFIAFFVPMFLYSFIATIFTVIGTYVAMSTFQDILQSESLSGLEFYDILYNPQSMIIIAISMALILTYLILYIPFLLGLIKSISQSYHWEAPDYKKNLKYWFSNLWNSFKTYWYIFAYVALIPALLFIVWWVILLYWMQYNGDFIKIWWFITGISVILFLFFALYRWTKAAFWLQSAVDSDNYSLENFKQSVQNTKEKFWRIIGNFILVWFIWWLVVWMIMWVVDNLGSSFGISANTSFEQFQSSWEDSNIDFQAILSDAISGYSPIFNIITNTLQWAIKTTFSIFLIVFTYIFFKRLELENSDKSSDQGVEL